VPLLATVTMLPLYLVWALFRANGGGDLAAQETWARFAAEHGDSALAYGREKLARKGLDAIVVNDVGGEGVGFESPDNEVWIVTAQEERHVPKESKARIAAAVLDAVLSRRSSSEVKVRR
jgi:phosphopantothenoylcysteine decarboxylase/phosphopantothenate--cysteine ligase